MANEMTVQKTESLSNSEAFTNKVLKEFGSNVAGSIQVTDYQRQLIQGYFIATDRALKMAEEKRVSKNENNKDHNLVASLVGRTLRNKRKRGQKPGRTAAPDCAETKHKTPYEPVPYCSPGGRNFRAGG